ncbi:type II toxin-antitoxin system RelE/ParE family toxin, partial [uncultured Sphingorhabdus sp.]|uniref:type II toxin-antitoxin system RelE family toxin n=1 Tax=uncultured Sphingorhabdus sp. TaxID=1686106 RepID=UPI002621DE9D
VVGYPRVGLKAVVQIRFERANAFGEKIDNLAPNPANPASLANVVKRLTGRPGYRMRIGDYRVIFDQDGTVLHILKIGPRGSVYED